MSQKQQVVARRLNHPVLLAQNDTVITMVLTAGFCSVSPLCLRRGVLKYFARVALCSSSWRSSPTSRSSPSSHIRCSADSHDISRWTRCFWICRRLFWRLQLRGCLTRWRVDLGWRNYGVLLGRGSTVSRKLPLFRESVHVSLQKGNLCMGLLPWAPDTS